MNNFDTISSKIQIMVALITYAVLLLMAVSVVMYLSYRDLKAK